MTRRSGGRARIVVFLVAVLAVGACSSAGSKKASTSAGSTTSPSTSAAPTQAGSVHATVAGWRLPAPVTRPAIAVTASNVFVLGGLTAGDVSTARVVSVDPQTGHSAVAGALAQAVHDAAGSSVAGLPTVFGGGGATTIDAVQAFQGQAGRVVGHLPRPRSDLAAASIGDTSYVVGGFDGSALTPDVLATTDGAHFRVVGRLTQGVRYAAVAALGRNLWVVGGQTGTSEGAAGTEVDLIQRFDTETGASTVVGHLPRRLAHAMAFVLGGHLYLAGGRTASAPLADVLAIASDGTVTGAGSLPAPRADAGTAVVGETAWLLGGETTGPTTATASAIAVSVG